MSVAGQPPAGPALLLLMLLLVLLQVQLANIACGGQAGDDVMIGFY